MKNFNKRMAAREGFTLVELIVVIAILAILAAVAYPAYTGYIDRAHDASALNQLGSIVTGAQACAVEAGSQAKSIKVETNASHQIINVSVFSDDKGTTAVKDFDVSLLKTLVLGSSVAEWTTISLDKTSYEGGAIWTLDDGWKPGTKFN